MGIKCEHSGGHGFQLALRIGTHDNQKNSNLWSRYRATSKIALPNRPIHLKNEANGLAWQGCLASSSKTAPRILKFSIVMGANYWFEQIFMPNWVLAFCAHNNFRLDRVHNAHKVDLFNPGNRKTPLDLAAKHGHEDIIKFLEGEKRRRNTFLPVFLDIW